MTTLTVRHLTTYRYRAPVAFGEHRAMLRPRESADQRTVSTRLVVRPEPAERRWAEDASGNAVLYLRFASRARELVLDATMTVRLAPLDPAALAIPPLAERLPFSYDVEEAPDVAHFVQRQYPDPERVLDRWVEDLAESLPDHGTWRFLTALNARIGRDFAYVRREEKGIQAPADTVRSRCGSCRDFAILMIEAVRMRGVAARFVSGYLRVRSDEPATVMAGGFTHAWLQVYLPQLGWIDFDPTSGGIGNRDLVRVAAVRDPELAVPIGGSFIGFPRDYEGMSVSVRVSEARVEKRGRSAVMAEPAPAGAVQSRTQRTAS